MHVTISRIVLIRVACRLNYFVLRPLIKRLRWSAMLQHLFFLLWQLSVGTAMGPCGLQSREHLLYVRTNFFNEIICSENAA